MIEHRNENMVGCNELTSYMSYKASLEIVVQSGIKFGSISYGGSEAEVANSSEYVRKVSVLFGVAQAV